MKVFYKLCLIALLVSLLAPSIAAVRKPKLILIVVVDQFRYDYLTRFRADYRGGIARLLQEGAVFADAHYPQYPTVTAVGHSTVLSGATPSVSGIIGNEWWDRGTNKLVTSVSDDKTLLLGVDPAAKGSSPRRLLVSTLADELKMRSKSSKVIGISIKDRGAILPVGHMADAAYWFDSGSNQFVSSTYYFSQEKPKLPEWVTKANEGWQISTRFDVWSPMGIQPGVKDFCSLKRGTCGRIEFTPFANELLEEFAEKAIASEHLGTEGTDILSVSFSANDYVGHRYGPDSEQVRDISIRTDRLLDKLFQFIDRTVGLGNVLVVFTADHGVAPVPPEDNGQHFPGGLLDANSYSDRISAKLAARFGSADWFLCSSNGFLYLNYDAVDNATCKGEAGADISSQCRTSKEDVRRIAAEEARKLPNIARVFTHDQLARGEVGTDPVGRAVGLGFNDVRSSDLVLVPEPYFMFKGEKNCKPDPEQEKTTHFTPYNYDSHVPLIFYGRGIPAGVYYERVLVNDVAPTLAALLDLESPSGSSGRILPQILRPKDASEGNKAPVSQPRKAR
jgi:predicted AlkP superfamily pyrophosphatase or phosphodiesterase